jgi:hypothetical protein
MTTSHVALEKKIKNVAEITHAAIYKQFGGFA